MCVNRTTCNIIEQKEESNFIFVKLEVGGKTIGIIVAYIQYHETDRALYLAQLEKFAEQVFSENWHTFIVGDLNADLHYEDEKVIQSHTFNRKAQRALRKILTKFNMLQYNTIKNSYDKQIDVILGTTSFLNVTCEVGTSLIGDHHLPYNFRYTITVHF